MTSWSWSRATLVGVAVLTTCLAVVGLGFGGILPESVGEGPTALLLAAAGLLNCVLIYKLLRPSKRRSTRTERINVAFRTEVEKFLEEMGHGPKRGKKQQKKTKKPPPSLQSGQKSRTPPADLVTRVAENVEILGGYREDLAALLQLYRLHNDDSLTLEEREKTISEINRFEKVIALPFLLEDSSSVQEETVSMLEELRRWFKTGDTTTTPKEEWTPMDLHEQIEQVIQSMPEDRARRAWIERHWGEIPLVLSRPNTLFEAFYHILDYFLEVSGGKAIHIQTAQRGEDIWIGIAIGPTLQGESVIASDQRIIAADQIWRDLGGQQHVGDGEVRILIPMHGPASIFTERAGESAGEKTG